jgi:hypothetical protein
LRQEINGEVKWRPKNFVGFLDVLCTIIYYSNRSHGPPSIAPTDGSEFFQFTIQKGAGYNL